MRYSQKGTVVKSSHMGINSCSSSSKLDAQYVQPHQKPKWPHLQERDMPVAFCRSCHVALQMLELQQKGSLWLFDTAESAKRFRFRGFTKGQREPRDIARRLVNRKAVCCTLLKWITKLKVSLPKSGQSTFTHSGVASNGPMAPCRSHRKNHTRQNWIF